MKHIEYQEYFGKIYFPDGFEEELLGKSIEDQIACYAIANMKLHEISYHFFNFKMIQNFTPIPIQHYDVIIKDGMVVGFMSGRRAILPYNYIYSEGYSSDNNGAGYKYGSGTDYYLICIPSNPNRAVNIYPPFGAPVHTITVPITEVDYDVKLPEEFLVQIQGKTIAEQLDYYWVLDGEGPCEPLYQANPSAYPKYWSTRTVPKLLRYDPNLEEIFTKNGIIVGIKYLSSYPKYSFEQHCIIKVGEIVQISEWFEDKYENARIGFFRDYKLQPILYL